MADALTVLARNGILRPDVTIAAAKAAGLELAVACVVLMGESGGGRMIWGHDGVDPAGLYVKGGPVTRANYLAYRDAVRAGRIKRQGVGDCQLTSAEFQDRGDQLGGCWVPYANQLSGFIGLANRMRSYGTRNGFRAYNGSGPAAEKYADTRMAQLARWRALLAGVAVPAVALAPATATPAPATPAAPVPAQREDDPVSRIELNVDPAGNFAETVPVEAGSSSEVISRAWLTFGTGWQPATFDVYALGGDGRVMGPAAEKHVSLGVNRRDFLAIPDGAVLATIAGHVAPGGRVGASLVVELKPRKAA